LPFFCRKGQEEEEEEEEEEKEEEEEEARVCVDDKGKEGVGD
jgi:hypothetical protein